MKMPEQPLPEKPIPTSQDEGPDEEAGEGLEPPVPLVGTTPSSKEADGSSPEKEPRG